MHPQSFVTPAATGGKSLPYKSQNAEGRRDPRPAFCVTPFVWIAPKADTALYLLVPNSKLVQQKSTEIV